MTTTTANNTIAACVRNFICATEELGAIATHLREAQQDLDNGNMNGTAMILDDALNAACALETFASAISSGIARATNAVIGEPIEDA